MVLFREEARYVKTFKRKFRKQNSHQQPLENSLKVRSVKVSWREKFFFEREKLGKIKSSDSTPRPIQNRVEFALASPPCCKRSFASVLNETIRNVGTEVITTKNAPDFAFSFVPSMCERAVKNPVAPRSISCDCYKSPVCCLFKRFETTVFARGWKTRRVSPFKAFPGKITRKCKWKKRLHTRSFNLLARSQVEWISRRTWKAFWFASPGAAILDFKALSAGCWAGRGTSSLAIS